MQLSWDSAILGLDVRSVSSSTILSAFGRADVLFADASPSFENATIFSDSPTSGFGGWGNPADDYQITTGAFANNFKVVYPVPHKIRRNYTARSTNVDPFGDGTPPAPDALWNYFTRASQDALIKGYVGDFEGFQTQSEGTVVS